MSSPEATWLVEGINLATLEMIFVTLREHKEVTIKLHDGAIPPTIAALIPELIIKREQ